MKAIVLTAGQVFTQAVTDGLIARSPFADVELPPQRHREEMHFLDAEQVNTLAAARSTTATAPRSILAAYGGLRAGELWALTRRPGERARPHHRRRRVDERGRRTYVGPTKTGKRRTITVPRFLAEMLGEHIGRYPSTTAACSPRPRAARSDHRNFMRRHFQPAVVDGSRGGSPDGLRFHDLRHTCAALLIANGRHLEEVKDYLGHSSIRVDERPLRAPLPEAARPSWRTRSTRRTETSAESRGLTAA